MAFAKRVYKDLGVTLVFLLLVLFPFGQIINLDLRYIGIAFAIHPIDLIALISIPFFFLKAKKPKASSHFAGFLFICAFSLTLSLSNFSVREAAFGSFYLLRLFSYLSFFVLVWHLATEKALSRNLLFNSLISVSVFSALFGWVQYLWLPDLTTLKLLNWDDHLFRLTGTFIDPGFSGIIFVFGALLSLHGLSRRKDRKYAFIALFLIVSLLFTYSRASYLAFLVGISTLIFLGKAKKLMLSFLILFVLILPVLPRPAGEGVRLERTQSVYNRFMNYQETFAIFSKHPLFGVGFNNICSERIRLYGDDYSSHSCGGSDSSLLFILATVGITGLLVFSKAVYGLVVNVEKKYYQVFYSVLLASFVHGIFSNTFFYAWVMAFMAIFTAISLRSEGDS